MTRVIFKVAAHTKEILYNPLSPFAPWLQSNSCLCGNWKFGELQERVSIKKRKSTCADIECLNHYLTLDYFEWQLENETKNFHFMELGWIVSFPRCGNKGKYCDYSVMLTDRKRGAAQLGKCVKLGEVLDNPEFEQNYPHTVGYYKKSSGEGAKFNPEYLEIRKVSTVEEFWLFLNAVDI